MCDHYASPLWAGVGGPCVDPYDYPLSEETRQALEIWARWYDRLGEGVPEEGWPDDEAEAFEREGRRLWRAVAEELGPDYRVGYFSETLQRHLWDAAELPDEDAPT
jgi:hypothetical protein